ncbi:MAG: lipo-like protein [Rhodocyclaceae bacterium]|nr:lipo-like protein [Rhodocyclaceae bacterium]
MRIQQLLPTAALGRALGRWLSREHHVHGISPPTPIDALAATLCPGDVLLVEGRTRISVAIKYLTQSTWSHAALYVGEHAETGGEPRAPHCFVEADIVEGVRLVGLGHFTGLHSRICRPVGLTDDDRDRVIGFALANVGHQYDLRNVVDLMRYLVPTPPVPQRWRRRMLALGSGDPTRAICSTLIARCFQEVRYPILPSIETLPAARDDCPDCVEEILRVRHHSLFVPRDFDVSPYFEVVKPTLARGFDYRRLHWAPETAPIHGTMPAFSRPGDASTP